MKCLAYKIKINVQLHRLFVELLRLQWRIQEGYPPLPPRPKIFSISCSFWENLTKLYVGVPLECQHPLLQGILDPPLDCVDDSLFITHFKL